MENQKMNFDVVVVGCGLSGLTAAYEALKIDPSIQICLLEAKDRVGGRTLTSDVELGDGRKEKFDLGGQWVARSQPDIMEILEELGLETYPQFITGEKVMQVGRGNKIRRYKSDIPSIGSFWGLIELQLFIWKAERLAKKIPIEDPYKWPSAQQYDSMTLSSFVDANLRNQGARDTIQAACRATMGTDLERISALFFLAYANSAGGIMKLLMATENGAQELRVKGGTQQISELLSDKIGRDRIHLNEAVESVDQTENFAVVKTSTGHTYRAKTVIVSIPPHCASDVKFIPPLPEHRKLLIDNMPVGHLTKFIVTYDKAYWRDARMSGEIVSNGGDPVLGCSSGPISVVYDATTNNDVPALVGFIAGRAGAEWHHKTAAERRSGVLNGLSDCLGSWALKPTSYAEKIWAEESYNGGCPVSFGVPGVMFAFHALRKPHGRVHWCGTETATHWAGYLSGAVQSGRRAACEVMRVRGHDVVKLERLVNREPYDFQSPPYAVSNVLTPVVTVLAVVLACVAVFYI